MGTASYFWAGAPNGAGTIHLIDSNDDHYVWNHLNNAELWESGYTLIHTGSAIPGINRPESALKDGIEWNIITTTYTTGIAENKFLLSKASTDLVLTGAQMYAIDKKDDVGMPYTGTILMNTPGACIQGPAPYTYNKGSTSAACRFIWMLDRNVK